MTYTADSTTKNRPGFYLVKVHSLSKSMTIILALPFTIHGTHLTVNGVSSVTSVDSGIQTYITQRARWCWY